jgi:RNA polymerase sigma factor (sigma-70 family)
MMLSFGQNPVARGIMPNSFMKRASDGATASVVPLLPRVASGDSLAVRECLRRYGGLVGSLARRFLKTPADVEEACQDIFVAVWKNAGMFDPVRGSEATFVAMIARRRLIDRLRSRGVQPELSASDLTVSADTLERYVDARAAVAGLEQCSEGQRQVILLASHGLTHPEIADELSLPLGTVKSHYARGIDLVKRALQSGKSGQ